MKFEPSNLTSQQIQATTNKLAKPNPPPLHWPPHTTNRSEQNHPPPLHRPHKSMCWRGKKEKTVGQPPIATHNPSHHSTDPLHHQQILTKSPTSTPSTTQIHVLEREKRKNSWPTTYRNPQSQPPPCPSHPTKIHKPSLKIEIGKP